MCSCKQPCPFSPSLLECQFPSQPCPLGPQHRWSISSSDMWMTTLSSLSQMLQSGDSHPKVGCPTAGSSAGPLVGSPAGSLVSSSLSSPSSSAWLTLSEWRHLGMPSSESDSSELSLLRFSPSGGTCSITSFPLPGSIPVWNALAGASAMHFCWCSPKRSIQGVSSGESGTVILLSSRADASSMGDKSLMVPLTDIHSAPLVAGL